MYRLIAIKNSSTQHLSTYINLRNLNTNDGNLKICSLCQKLHNFSFATRNQSTHTYFKKLRKKREDSVKKYAELLVVTNQNTSEQKAPIRKLSSAELKMFAKTDLNLAEFYKLKALRKHKYTEEHTYHNLTIIENIPTISDAVPDSIPSFSTIDISEEKETNDILEALEDIKLPSQLGTFQPEIIEDEHIEPVKEIGTPSAYVEQSAREEIISRTLAAYIEICCYLKYPQRGLNTFLFHKSRTKNKLKKMYPAIKNIKVYNSLLKGFSAKGDYHKVQEILGYVKDEGVKLNVQSYAAIFECLGRIDIKDSHLKQIRIHTKDALKLGITFDKIMSMACFLSDQREMVLKAMRCYDSEYKITLQLPIIQYNNHLINRLNHESQLRPPEKLNINNGLFKSEELSNLINKQIECEKLGYITIKSVEAKPEPTEDIIKYRQALQEHLKLWEKAALEGFNRDLSSLTARRSILSLEPYLRSIPTKDFVQIIVDEAKKIAEGSETYSPTRNQLHRDLGIKVYMRYKILRKQKMGVMDKVAKIHEDYCNYYANTFGKTVDATKVNYLNTRQHWQWFEHLQKTDGATIATDHQAWVPTVIQSIGKCLYHIIMHDLKIDVNVMRINRKHKNYLPAFYTIFRTQGRIVKEEVKPHPVLSRLYQASVPETLMFPINEVPMLCPPIPWCNISTGGYLIAPCEMIRLPMHAVTQRRRLKKTPLSEIYPSLDSLNQLAYVPWKVNNKILDVILEVFNSGGSSKLDVPEPPSALPAPPSITNDMDKMQRYTVFRQKLQNRRKRAEMYSLWCDCLYRLSLSNHFRNDIFWLPHNMDFRGRVYPIPPHLNHLGSDLARSMLIFAEARPLGKDGLDWLKLHLVNLTGVKKQDSINDRLIFANEVMDKVLDSADYPLTGKMWWADSDEPWQTLACCMEIANAHRSPDPEQYMSSFPVHQDGSCNGLQHYAALGRDSAGAHSVNLTPSNAPQDVYNAVVILVEQQRAKDAENGSEVAKHLEGFVKRKVIKQTIMTTVYGVTRFGARLQIARQLKDLDNFPKDHVWTASAYLTTRTFESLRTMFTSTREIQDWFTDCARLISSVGGHNVEWVTPLGLPIVQPYNKYRKLGSEQVYESFHMDAYEKPNVMKQKNAFPPNFIHSLDSSHMMLTSLHCERAGITFVSVHDCYWTHPSTVPIMNKICREQFVALHSQPILENLSMFFADKYSYSNKQFSGDGSVVDLTRQKLNKVLRKLPTTSDFDIKKVLESVYFFS